MQKANPLKKQSASKTPAQLKAKNTTNIHKKKSKKTNANQDLIREIFLDTID